MINFFDQVPTVYANASRDFQYIGWLINIVFNNVKHNVDVLYNLPNTNSDPRLTEVLAMTLGFKIKRNYDQKQLAALVNILPSVLKCKGTEKAITMAGEALLAASGANGSFSCKVNNNCLEVVLPKELVDTSLFEDLLPYILPAGMTCRIVRKTQMQDTIPTIEVVYDDIMKADWHNDISWDTDAQTSTGLANLFDVDNKPANFNFANYEDDSMKLNTGLLDSSVIPLLDSNSLLTDYKTGDESNKTEVEE